MLANPLVDRILTAIQTRAPLLAEPHENAVRLFNGFYEGCPTLLLDAYADTLVIFNYSPEPTSLNPLLDELIPAIRQRLPWLQTGLVKTRAAAHPDDHRGRVIFGERPAHKIRENGICYAVKLNMNQDASFYLDTRMLRAWLTENMAGKTVLNLFAYTGSLGVAALAGGATRVVQSDLNRKFLNLAKESCTMNGLSVHKEDYHDVDFFDEVAAQKSQGNLYDCVILDPPFFSTTQRGRVDLVGESQRLINKVRPLVKDGGWLALINNALFVKGSDYLASLEALGRDGYLTVERLVPAPPDMTGTPETIVGYAPMDPSPYNHPTKITLLRVKRKA